MLYISIRNRQQQQLDERQQERPRMEAPSQQKQTALIDQLACTPVLHSPLVLDVAMTVALLLVILLGGPPEN